MQRLLAMLIAALVVSACAAEMWIPIQTLPRQPVAVDQVQYLESRPERPHEVIGIITPPSDEYDTEAEAVNEMRREAAEHGADGVYIESKTKKHGWRFGPGFGGVLGGSFEDIQFRAKAIVWQ